MTELFNVNSFAEAMFYYFGKANENGVKKRLNELIKNYPEQKISLKETTAPAIALEALLDSKLHPDRKLVSKFFGKFDDTNTAPKYSSCLAFSMIYSYIILHLDYSADEMRSHLLELNIEERMQSFSLNLADRCCFIEKCEIDEAGIARRVESSDLSVGDKWKILNAVLTYQTHLKDLLSLLMPAARLIENAENIYKAAIEEFRSRYSQTNGRLFFETNAWVKLKMNCSDTIKIAPLILDFSGKNRIVEIYANDNASEMVPSQSQIRICKAFIGISRHLIKKQENTDTAALSDKLKILSDSTRLDMLFYLCSHKAYGLELSDRFGVNPSTISYHVAKLMDAGFLNGEFDGGRTYYSADKKGIQSIIDAFAEKIK